MKRASPMGVSEPTELVKRRLTLISEQSVTGGHDDWPTVLEIYLDSAYSDVYYRYIPQGEGADEEYWLFAHIARPA